MAEVNMDVWRKWETASVVGHIRYLYKFEFPGRRGSTFITYCTGRDNVIFDGHTYIPYPCVHGDMQKSESDSEVDIQMAANQLWIEAVITNVCRKLKITVYRYRMEMSTGITLFKGNANQYSVRNNVISMKFVSNMLSGESQIIVYYTQTHCNHSMYGPFCNLDFQALRVDVPPGAWEVVGKKTIALSADFELDAAYWKNCIIMYDVIVKEQESVFMYEQDNMSNLAGQHTILTKYPMSVNTDSSKYSLTLAPNCNLVLSRCRDVFGNLAASCGYPDMPLVNYSSVDCTAGEKATGGPVGNVGESPYG